MVRTFLIAGLTTAFIVSAALTTVAQEKPVGIAFDTASKRVDLITGETLPDYTSAQRGSVQFFLGRLDQPNDYFDFFHDGVRQAKISDLFRMEKVQPQFAIWRLRYRSGSKNTPRIHHLAVSFIPLDPTTGQPAKRAYVLLNDLSLIDWDE